MPWEKQFDKREVLERAVRAFWAGGYEATSMTELLDQMGIQKGSFYATFGCKRQVLLDCLETYTKSHFAAMGALGREASPRAALERHLAEVTASTTGPEGCLGCFMVNTSLELSARDPEIQQIAQRTLAAHEELYRALIESAQTKGEMAAELDPDATARGILALVLGMRVLGRSGAPREVIESVRDQALRLLGEAASS
jgi:TetR/AcrR family transcriptional repressor of nem operon